MRLAEFANRLVDQCDSTNDLARALGEAGFPHGTWVSTRNQAQGRGRQGRPWVSLSGNLFLSMVARLQSKEWITWVPLAIAVGTLRAIRNLDPALGLKIKWPNDLHLRGAKVGGILCESVGSKNQSFAVLGAGINCAYAPEGIDQPVSCLNLSADRIRLPIVEAWKTVLREVESGNLDGIRGEYERHSVLQPGTQIEWVSVGVKRRGVVEGLGFFSELQVKSEGEMLSLFAEDVKIHASVLSQL